MFSLVNSFIANFKIRKELIQKKELMQLNCNDKDLDIYDKFELYSKHGNKIMQQEYLYRIWDALKQKKKLRKYIDNKFISNINNKCGEKYSEKCNDDCCEKNDKCN
tara:strand:- start:367 stop:684 length:318 start_codon:yes stop_codon:yes gene_type:complete